MEYVICLCVFTFLFILMTLFAEYRSVPYGKGFIKKFNEKLYRISQACTRSHSGFILVSAHNKNFKVAVKEDVVPAGLEYSTIPMYTSNSVYIDDEVVCRVHHISHFGKDKVFLEFSSERKYLEVIEIVDIASQVAKSLNAEYIHSALTKDSKSFYARSEDTDNK